jgi:hypothetical protein
MGRLRTGSDLKHPADGVRMTVGSSSLSALVCVYLLCLQDHHLYRRVLFEGLSIFQ